MAPSATPRGVAPAHSDPFPPSGGETHPDPIPPAAWQALYLLDEEQVLHTWRSVLGFLVLTNLRCFLLRRAGELFPPHPWRSGPSFFFYNMKPPRALLGRYVELSEERSGAAGHGLRFAVRDASEVVSAIADARIAGMRQWNDRRGREEMLREARRRAREAEVRGRASSVVRVPCPFRGNQVIAALLRCPYCGASVSV
jgi:hypothetical protein